MGPNKDNDSKVKRKMTRIIIVVKKEIIAKHENGVRVSDLATQFGMANILKRRQKQNTLDKFFVRQRPSESQAESERDRKEKKKKTD
jgi:transposase-like protein